MSTNRVIVLIGAALIVIAIIWMLIRGKRNGFLEKEERSKEFILGIILGYVAAIGLLVVLWFREFGLFSDCILTGCCVLGVELENRMLLGSIKRFDDNPM